MIAERDVLPLSLHECDRGVHVVLTSVSSEGLSSDPPGVHLSV
jgi:hypothetical protein